MIASAMVSLFSVGACLAQWNIVRPVQSDSQALAHKVAWWSTSESPRTCSNRC